MQEISQNFIYAVWIAIFVGGSSFVAIAGFIWKVGADLKAGRDAQAAIVNLVASHRLHEERFADYRVEVAQKYATSHDLAEAEGRTAMAIEGLRSEIRTMNDRMLAVISNK